MPAPAPPPDIARSRGASGELALATLALAAAAATAVFAPWEVERFIGGRNHAIGYPGLGLEPLVWWDGTGQGHLGFWVLVPAVLAAICLAIAHVLIDPSRRTRRVLAVSALAALVAATAVGALDRVTRSAETGIPVGTTVRRDPRRIPGEFYLHSPGHGSSLTLVLLLAATTAAGLALVLARRSSGAPSAGAVPSGTRRRRVVEAIVATAGATAGVATLLPWIEADGGQWTPVGLGIMGYQATDQGLHGSLVLALAGAGVVMALAGARPRSGNWLRAGGLTAALATAAFTLAASLSGKDVLDHPPVYYWVRGPGIALCIGGLALAAVGAASLALPRRKRGVPEG